MNGEPVKSDVRTEDTKHTPGPWQLKPVGSIDFRRPGEDGAQDVCIVADNGICPGIVWDFMREGEANARLIAAAPEMAAALKRALSWLSSYPGGCAEGAYMDAVNALKKAGCYE